MPGLGKIKILKRGWFWQVEGDRSPWPDFLFRFVVVFLVALFARILR